ncbi:MAG: TonB-dependent receptor [Steroidobacteraceae bacterium]|nr:TonB-dependent receptor [Steroidobacteraceae bacterium]
MLAGSVAFVLAAAPVAAQDSGALEEIIVTAQKREQRLQDVPFSVAALSAADIEASNVVKLDQVALYTPGLYLETIGLGRPFLFIRGIGSGAFDVGSDPSVALFVDEVYVSRFTGLMFDLFDVERIEVLKGPQGTLFGRNAAGGAVSMVTRPPSDHFTGQFSAQLGNYDAVQLRAGISGPLGDDRWRFRLAGARNDSKGYIRNTLTGKRHQDENSYGARGQLQFVPSDAFDALLTLEYARDDVGMLAQQNVTDNVLFRPLGDLAGVRRGLSLDQQYTTDGYQEREAIMASLHMNWDTPIGRFTSITAFRSNEFEELHDQDASALDTLDRYAYEDSDTWSQELRHAGRSGGSRVDWVVGLYYLREDAFREEDWIIGADTAFAALMNGGQRFPLQDLNDVTTESYAAFGQATFALSERWNLTVGGRYSRDEKSNVRSTDNFGVGSQCTPATPCGPFPANVLLPANYALDYGDEWSSFDPVATVDWHPTEHAILYATYREGFKSGGFQPTLPANAARASFIFAPEDVTSVEVGLKSQWLAGRLQLNLALFDNSYDDLQFITGSGVGPGGVPIVVVDNAANATARGGEIQIVARPVERLRLTAGYSYTDATLDDYVDDAGVSQAGKQMIRTPKNQANVIGEYSFPLGSAGDLTLRGEWSYRSKVFFDPANSPATGQKGFDVVNARLEYAPAGARWAVAAYGKNLTDELYCQNTVTLSAATVGTCSTGAPRTYGIAFSYRHD